MAGTKEHVEGLRQKRNIKGLVAPVGFGGHAMTIINTETRMQVVRRKMIGPSGTSKW